ncbi:hypothetical protein AALG83_09195, partial [Christensenellaceae bacterium 44-20]
MKKTISIVLALLLVAMLFVSCSKGGEEPDNSPVVDPGDASTEPSGDGEVSEVAVILQTYNGSFWSDVMRGVDKAID